METEDKKKSKKNSILIISLFAIVLALLFIVGLIPKLINRENIDRIAEEDPLPAAVVMQIEPNLNPTELILPSSAQAWHTTPIWSRVNGYLIRYLVDIGDRVKTGDLLAEIDTPETDEQVAQAQAELRNSIANRDIAAITSERWQKLWDRNQEAVSKQEVDQYNANYIATQALVVSNEKNLARLVAEQQFKFIYAPFDGIITARTIDIGSLIYGTINGVPQELFQIAQDQTIRFFVEVPQNYFRQIKEGIETIVKVKEYPGKNFKGIVTRYAKALDPVARTLTTEVDVDNREGFILPGVYGQVTFFMYPEFVNFIIPTTAVIIRAGFPHIAVVDNDNIVHLHKVQIGRDYGKKLEIVDGLQKGDRIITLPSDSIKEGVKVQIIKSEDQTPTTQPKSESQTNSNNQTNFKVDKVDTDHQSSSTSPLNEAKTQKYKDEKPPSEINEKSFLCLLEHF